MSKMTEEQANKIIQLLDLQIRNTVVIQAQMTTLQLHVGSKSPDIQNRVVEMIEMNVKSNIEILRDLDTGIKSKYQNHLYDIFK